MALSQRVVQGRSLQLRSALWILSDDCSVQGGGPRAAALGALPLIVSERQSVLDWRRVAAVSSVLSVAYSNPGLGPWSFNRLWDWILADDQYEI